MCLPSLNDFGEVWLDSPHGSCNDERAAAAHGNPAARLALVTFSILVLGSR